MTGELRVFAHGGGVQSTAALVLSARGEIDFPVHLFSNVGDDSEHPATLEYVRKVSQPWAAEHGIELVELRKTNRQGETVTLLQTQLRRAWPTIPVRMANEKGSPGSRGCTTDFKVNVLAKWCVDHGATAENPAVMGIGISVDEIQRAGPSRRATEVREHPLLDLGLRRSDCHRIIAEAGLPTPPKSACFFCPFKRGQQWAEMHGVELCEIFKTMRDGSRETLMGRLRRPGGQSLPIPVYYSATGPPVSRACTSDFKRRVIGKWLREHGACSTDPAKVGIGISVDEIERAGNGREEEYENRIYPLIDLGLRRADCYGIIESAGLPVPPKSSCFFCPFHRKQVWSELRRDRPDLFDKAAELETFLGDRQVAAGKTPVYLTRTGKTLPEAVGVAQDTLPLFDSGFESDGCDEGFCGV